MRRDDDLNRRILLAVEADPEPMHLLGRDDCLESACSVILEHCQLGLEAGMLGGNIYKNGANLRLTFAGHDYLAAIRDEGIWARTKDAVAETGGNASLEILKSLATGFVKKRIKDYTGIEM